MTTLDSARVLKWQFWFGVLALSMLAGCKTSPPLENDSDSTPSSSGETVEWAASPEWLDTYDPERSAPGFNLILFRRRTPLLMDMDGTVVHAWPEVRAAGRARLFPDDRLALIGESGDFEEYDWEGNETWRYTLDAPNDFLHHDFIRLESGNYLLLAHDPTVGADYLLEVDRDGTILWRWDAAEHLVSDFANTVGESNNRTHINSVFELPANRWHERGDDRFLPGNILLSARNLNTIYIVSRATGEVVWKFSENLDYQHEAIMIPIGTPGAGNIVLFDNGYYNRKAFRQSAIVEVDPTSQRRVWEYRKRGFYSSTGGTQQILPNGNLLVTSSQGGRVFEVTKSGSIVWQWSPPYLPMRVSRYPAEFTPAFSRLAPPSERPITARDPDRFVDANLYAFALPHQVQRVRLGDRSRKVLKQQSHCQVLQLPGQASIRFGYGHGQGSVQTPFVHSDDGGARFVATLRALDQEQPETIFERVISPEDVQPAEGEDPVRIVHNTVPLETYSGQTVELCLTILPHAADSVSASYVWEDPSVLTPGRVAQFELDPTLDQEALEQQEKHLKAIGYIN